MGFGLCRLHSRTNIGFTYLEDSMLIMSLYEGSHRMDG
jgi:hypothetical protein